MSLASGAGPIDQYRNAAQVAKDENELVVRHAPLVKRIAYHLMGRLPQTVEVDDLVQAGMIGLLEAARKFDPTQGASFETYAGIRIRGCMIDQVRPCDWTPRSVHRKAREIADVVRRIEHREGREARDVEIIDELDMDADAYHRTMADVSTSRMLSYEELCPTGEDIGIGLDMDDGDDRPEAALSRQDFRLALAGAIRGLSEREQQVLSLYYDDELNLREIGEVLGVTESRVCQIHAKCVVRLRGMLTDWVEDEAGVESLLQTI